MTMSSIEMSFAQRAAAELTRQLMRLNKHPVWNFIGENNNNDINIGDDDVCGEDQVLHLTSKGKPPMTCVSITNLTELSHNGVSSSKEDLSHLLTDVTFFTKFSSHFKPKELCTLAQVCKSWRDILYSLDDVWSQLTLSVDFKDIRRRERANGTVNHRQSVYDTINGRHFTSLTLKNACDDDIIDLMENADEKSIARIKCITVRQSSVTDGAVDVLLAPLVSLESLEISGCNEMSESALWTRLVPSITSLTLKDCINVSDETICVISQMLIKLKHFHLQAYHCTDVSVDHLTNGDASCNIQSLILDHCWEMSDQGIASLANSMNNLTVLSLTGSSQVTDDAVEVITEQMRLLKCLDISWCPRVTDAALEFIAYDLADSLVQLNIDRCPLVTDTGLRYASMMPKLKSLSVRWCTLITDRGFLSLCTMKCLSSLAVSGCHQITPAAFCSVTRCTALKELDVTNCRGATAKVIKHIEDNSPQRIVVFR